MTAVQIAAPLVILVIVALTIRDYRKMRATMKRIEQIDADMQKLLDRLPK